MVTKTLVFQKDFRCHSCTDCCRNWTTPLRKAEYERLQKLLSATPDFFRVEDTLERLENSTYAHAKIKKRADGACVFLNATTNFCDLHSRLGEEALPSVCRTYPRQPVRVKATDVGSEYEEYVLSAVCPTVRELLLTPQGCRIETHPQYRSALYDGYRANTEKNRFTLLNGTIDLEAFQCLKDRLCERFLKTDQSVETILAGIGAILDAVYAGRVAPEVRAIDQALAEFDALDTAPWAASDPVQHLTLLGSWLTLRASFPLNKPEMLHIVQRYGRAQFTSEEGRVYQSAYAVTVRPLLEAEHWILRNFLATKIFLNPQVILYDYIPFGFVSACLALGLIKMLLIEQAGQGKALGRADVLQAVGLVEENLSHLASLEELFADTFATRRLPPAALATAIHL